MRTYAAFGLAIASVLPLPALPEDEARPEASIIHGDSGLSAAGMSGSRSCFCVHATSTEALFSWKDVGCFAVRDGREIIIDAAPGSDPAAQRMFLLGPGLAMLLHQRDQLVLHGSAVAVEGSCIAFLGASGHGKSTAAAALLARGHRFITDDVLAISLDGRLGPMVHAGPPQLRLWPEAATSLGNDPELLPRLHPALDKRAVAVPRVERAPAPLTQIYLLAEGPSLQAEPLPPQQAFLQLMQHAQCVAHCASRSFARRSQRHISACLAIAGTVPVHRLARPRALDALDALAAFIEERQLAS